LIGNPFRNKKLKKRAASMRKAKTTICKKNNNLLKSIRGNKAKNKKINRKTNQKISKNKLRKRMPAPMSK